MGKVWQKEDRENTTHCQRDVVYSERKRGRSLRCFVRSCAAGAAQSRDSLLHRKPLVFMDVLVGAWGSNRKWCRWLPNVPKTAN